jgi:hypothetical protein
MAKQRNETQTSNDGRPRTLRRRSSLGAWIAGILVVVVAVLLWAQADRPTDNPTTSSTTTPPDADNPAPAGPAMAPASPSTPGG